MKGRKARKKVPPSLSSSVARGMKPCGHGAGAGEVRAHREPLPSIGR